MADLSMVFDLLAKDRASSVLNDVGDAADRAGRKSEGMGGLLKGALAGAAGALVAGGVVAGLKGLYDAAAESAKVSAITTSVVKSTGQAAGLTADQIGDLSTALSNKTGMDDEAIQSGENLLLTFTNVRDEVGKGNDVFSQASGLALDMATVMGGDSSTSAMQLGKALNDPIKGVTALAKSGVSFTEQQKEQIATLVKSGDVLGAQKIILGEVGKEFGGAAAAAATPMDRFKTTVGNLQEQIGTGLIPIFDTLAGGAMQVIGILFSGDFTGGPFAEDSPIVSGLFTIRDGAIALGGWLKGTLIPAIGELGGWLNDHLVPAFAAVGRALFDVGVFFATHETALKALGVAAGILAGLVVAAWAVQVAAAIAGAASQVVSWVAVAVGSQAAAEGATVSTAQIVFGWIAAAAAAVFNAAIVVGGWVLMGAQALLGAARMALAWLIALGPIGLVIAAVLGLVALIVANWQTIVDWTTSAFRAVGDALAAAWEWIKNAFSAALQFVVDLFMNWTLLGLIISHWEEIKKAFSDGVEAAISFVTGLPQRALDALASLGSTIAGAAAAAWQWYNDNVNAKIREGLAFIGGLPGKILSSLGDMGKTLYEKGKDLINGLLNGAKSILSKIGTFFLNMVPDWIRGPFESALGIGSPSKVFAGYGANIGEGLLRGLGAMRPAIADELAHLADTQAADVLVGTRPGGLGYRPPGYDTGGGPAAGGGTTNITTNITAAPTIPTEDQLAGVYRRATLLQPRRG